MKRNDPTLFDIRENAIFGNFTHFGDSQDKGFVLTLVKFDSDYETVTPWYHEDLLPLDLNDFRYPAIVSTSMIESCGAMADTFCRSLRITNDIEDCKCYSLTIWCGIKNLDC